MKCKHKRELYKDNRICKDCMAERETELMDALKNVRKAILLLNAHESVESLVLYINRVLND